MPSISIQGRVDADVWESLKGPETNTQFLQRLCAHYVATHPIELQDIAPTPAAAVAVLLHSHRLLNQLMQNAAIALPEVPTTAAATVAATETTKQPPAASTRFDDDF